MASALAWPIGRSHRPQPCRPTRCHRGAPPKALCPATARRRPPERHAQLSPPASTCAPHCGCIRPLATGARRSARGSARCSRTGRRQAVQDAAPGRRTALRASRTRACWSTYCTACTRTRARAHDLRVLLDVRARNKGRTAAASRAVRRMSGRVGSRRCSARDAVDTRCCGCSRDSDERQDRSPRGVTRPVSRETVRPSAKANPLVGIWERGRRA
mmetsp:Transcript_1321/g.4312  ORF Transcript_1321/g.4312 Transcript_1321/m.4312 type:complete len:215 (+) Transcript_1321:624-1268(+)